MTHGGGISREVRNFVTAHLHSITQLELLMVLHGARDRSFTPQELSRQLRVPERFVTGQLVDFGAGGLAEADEAGETWRYAPRSPHGAVVDELAGCVRQRKRAVHDLILAGPSDDVQVFSDAFRLRSDDDD